MVRVPSKSKSTVWTRCELAVDLRRLGMGSTWHRRGRSITLIRDATTSLGCLTKQQSNVGVFRKIMLMVFCSFPWVFLFQSCWKLSSFRSQGKKIRRWLHVIAQAKLRRHPNPHRRSGSQAGQLFPWLVWRINLGKLYTRSIIPKSASRGFPGRFQILSPSFGVTNQRATVAIL